MAVAYVVKSRLPKDKQPFIFGEVDIEDVKKMIQAYRDKLIAIAPKARQLPAEHQIDLEKEYLGLVLKRDDVKLVMEQDGCGDLIALFSIEDKDINKNTIILMGLEPRRKDDEKDTYRLLKDDSGKFGKAEETWPPTLHVTKDDDFNAFFNINSDPPKP